ncbi:MULTISPECIES: hypothetical protein [unclassified Clostridium]|uniref:hypothetical protein n=1 Tax=Clostridium TaxID=1485 RepID=UPI001C8BF6CC|nr:MULTISPECIES: hypothetical protein [unclassified Clostridium]MBX9138004.1 hypothetical protein [Clostridium sp. K12(2020)]MBX9144733.1 hypothetical protein [Clostridium sp. K13]MDU2292003.1 hypothetical protein [Clostridium celatum]MDU4327474.1 hypothetical protein [Clostridium celatum]
MLYRVIIKRETAKYFIGKSYDNKRYKIEKNEYSKKLRVGSDSYFYARKEEKLLSTILVPISDEEAGVLDIDSSI